MSAHRVFVKRTFICVDNNEEEEHVVRHAKTMDTATLAARRRRLLTTLQESDDDVVSSLLSRVCPKAVAAFGSGDLHLARAPPNVCSSVLALAMNDAGAAVLERVCDVSQSDELAALADEFRGSVLDACMSPSAHRVLLKFVRCLGSHSVAFMADELRGAALQCALNVSGSAVLCELLLFTAREKSTQALVDELLASDVGALCCHKSGHEVMIAVLSNATPQQQHAVACHLNASLQRFARHRFASCVLSHALLQGPRPISVPLAFGVMQASGAVVSLACHGFGLEVVRALLQVPEASQQALFFLKKGQHRIMKDKFGTRLLTELKITEASDGSFTTCIPAPAPQPLSLAAAGA